MQRLFLFFVALFLSACSGLMPTPDPCSQTEVVKYIDALNGVARRFDDGVTLAGSTPRAGLAPVLADLQSIRRDTEDLQMPACAENAKGALVTYMNAEIEAFRLFLVKDADSRIQNAFDTAANRMATYKATIAALGK